MEYNLISEKTYQPEMALLHVPMSFLSRAWAEPQKIKLLPPAVLSDCPRYLSQEPALSSWHSAVLNSNSCCIISGAALASWAALPLGSLIPFCHSKIFLLLKKVLRFTCSLFHFRSLKMYIPPFPLSLIF